MSNPEKQQIVKFQTQKNDTSIPVEIFSSGPLGVLPWQCFCQGALQQNFLFFIKMAFSRSKCIHIGFFSSNSKSAPQNLPLPNFSQIGLKIKEARILTWNDTKNCLMTSYLPHSDDISKIIINFERFHSRVPSCQVWW